MHIVTKLLDPSREDAVRLRRSEKQSMLLLMHAASVLEDLKKEIPERLGMIDDGHERLNVLAQETDRLLADIRVTVPENQRHSIENTAHDYEVRIAPSATPSPTNILMTRDEFQELVDCAREMCKECTEDDESCAKCRLYKLLTCILPVENYHSMLLCPYNLGRWKH